MCAAARRECSWLTLRRTLDPAISPQISTLREEDLQSADNSITRLSIPQFGDTPLFPLTGKQSVQRRL